MFQTLLEKQVVNRLVDGDATYEDLFNRAGATHLQMNRILRDLLKNGVVARHGFPTAYCLAPTEIAKAMKKVLEKEREQNDFSALLEDPCTVNIRQV